MKKFIQSFTEKRNVSLVVALLLLVSFKAQAATTVTVDDNNKVTVTPGIAQPVVYTPAVLPVVVTREVSVGDFEGRISQVNYSQNWIVMQDSNGTNRQVSVKPEMVNSYRIGDYVLIHPTTDVMLIT